MSGLHPGAVRLNRTPFSEKWEVVQVDSRGRITWRRPLHPDDAATLERVYQQTKTEKESRDREAAARPEGPESGDERRAP